MLRVEKKTESILPWPAFIRRLCFSFSVGGGLIIASLLVGMFGYHYLESQSWLDAFLNASMILSGMGPLAQPQTVAGKIFAGFYALYSGFAVLIIAAIAFGPVIHRMLHLFHADDSDLGDDDTSGKDRPSHGSQVASHNSHLK